MEVRFYKFSIESTLFSFLPIIILVYIVLFFAYCYTYIFHHGFLLGCLTYGRKNDHSIDDDSIEVSKGSVSFDYSSFDCSPENLSMTDRYRFRTSLGTFLFGNNLKSLQSLMSTWNLSSTPLRTNATKTALEALNPETTLISEADSWEQKYSFRVEVSEEEILPPEDDLCTNSGFDLNRDENGSDASEEALRNDCIFKTSLGRILFTTTFPNLDAEEQSTSRNGKFESYLLVEETVIMEGNAEARNDCLQSIFCELADADVLFSQNESLFDSEEALDSQIIASSADFISTLQTELAECKSENRLLHQEVDTLTLQLTTARTQLAAFEQQAAWKSLENMRLSTSNTKLQKKVEDLKTSASDNVDLNLNLNLGGLDVIQRELLIVSEKLKTCEEELALKQDVCYSQGRQLVELRRQLNLTAATEIVGSRGLQQQQSVGSMKLNRDGYSTSRSIVKATRESANPQQLSSPVRVKLFSANMDEDVIVETAVFGKDTEIFHPNIGNAELFAEYPLHSKAEEVLLRSTPLTDASAQHRRGSSASNNRASKHSFNKFAQIKSREANGTDESFLKINELEMTLRVRSAEVSALVSQLSEAEFRREDERAAVYVLAAANARISQLESELMAQASNVNKVSCGKTGIASKSEENSTIAVNYRESDCENGGDSSHIFVRRSSTIVEFESFETPEPLELPPSSNSEIIVQLQAEIEQSKRQLLQQAELSRDYESLKLRLNHVLEIPVSDQKTFERREKDLVFQIQILEKKLEQQKSNNSNQIIPPMSQLCDAGQNGSRSEEKMMLDEFPSSPGTIAPFLSNNLREVDELTSLLEAEKAALKVAESKIDTLEETLRVSEHNRKLLGDELSCVKEELEIRLVQQAKSNDEQIRVANMHLQEHNHNEGVLRERLDEMTSVQATIEESLSNKLTEIAELKNSFQKEKAALKVALLKVATLQETLSASEDNSKLLSDELSYLKNEFESMRVEVLTQSVNESSIKHQCQIMDEALLASEERNRSIQSQLHAIQCEAEELQAKVHFISAARQNLIDVDLKKLQVALSHQQAVNEELQIRFVDFQRNANEMSTNQVNRIRELENNVSESGDKSSKLLAEKQIQLDEKQREIVALELRVLETGGLLSGRIEEINAILDREAKAVEKLEATTLELTATQECLATERSNVLSLQLKWKELHWSAHFQLENLRFESEDIASRLYAHSFVSREIEDSLRSKLASLVVDMERLQLEKSELNVKNDALIFKLQKENERLLEKSNLLQQCQFKLLQSEKQLASERDLRERFEVEEVFRCSLMVLESKLIAEDAHQSSAQLQQKHGKNDMKEPLYCSETKCSCHVSQDGNDILLLQEEQNMRMEDHRGRCVQYVESLSTQYEAATTKQFNELEELKATLRSEQSEVLRLSRTLKALKVEHYEYISEVESFVSTLQQEFSLLNGSQSQALLTLRSGDKEFEEEELNSIRERKFVSLREQSAVLESMKRRSVHSLAEQEDKIAVFEATQIVNIQTITRQVEELASLQEAYADCSHTNKDLTVKLSALEMNCDHIMRLHEEEKEKLSAHLLKIDELEAAHSIYAAKLSDMEITRESDLRIIAEKAEKIVTLELSHELDLQTIKDLAERNVALEEVRGNNQRILNDLGVEMNRQLEYTKGICLSKESDIHSCQRGAAHTAMLLQALWQHVTAFIERNSCFILHSSSLATGTMEDFNPMELLEVELPLPRESPTLGAEDDYGKEVWELKARTRQTLHLEHSGLETLNGCTHVDETNLTERQNSDSASAATLPCAIEDIHFLAEQLHRINETIQVISVENKNVSNQPNNFQREENSKLSEVQSFSKQWNYNVELTASDKFAVTSFLESITMKVNDLESKQFEKSRSQHNGGDVNKTLRKSIDVLNGELDGLKMSLAAKVDELHYVFLRLGQLREKIIDAIDNEDVDSFPQLGCPGVDAPDDLFLEKLSQIVDDMQKFRGEALSLREADREKDRQINSLVEVIAAQLSDFSTIEAVLRTWETCVGKSLGLNDCQNAASLERFSAFANNSQRAVSGLAWLTEDKTENKTKWIGEDSLRLLDEMQRFFLENTQVVSAWRNSAAASDGCVPLDNHRDRTTDLKLGDTINSKSMEQLKPESSSFQSPIELEHEDSIVKKRRESLNLLEKQILEYQREMANLTRLQHRCEKEKQTLLLQLDVTKAIRKKQLKIKSSRQGLLLNLPDESVKSNSFQQLF